MFEEIDFKLLPLKIHSLNKYYQVLTMCRTPMHAMHTAPTFLGLIRQRGRWTHICKLKFTYMMMSVVDMVPGQHERFNIITKEPHQVQRRGGSLCGNDI